MKGRKRRGQVLRVSKSQWDDASEETGRDKDTRGRGKEARETEIDSVQSERDKAIEEDRSVTFPTINQFIYFISGGK